jgi:hypothetical protein
MILGKPQWLCPDIVLILWLTSTIFAFNVFISWYFTTILHKKKRTKLHFKSSTAERRHVFNVVLCVGIGGAQTHAVRPVVAGYACPCQHSTRYQRKTSILERRRGLILHIVSLHRSFWLQYQCNIGVSHTGKEGTQYRSRYSIQYWRLYINFSFINRTKCSLSAAQRQEWRKRHGIDDLHDRMDQTIFARQLLTAASGPIAQILTEISDWININVNMELERLLFSLQRTILPGISL